MRSIRRVRGFLFFIGLNLFLTVQGFCDGQLIVYASDTSSAGAPPPASAAILDGTVSESFGTNAWICFSNVTAGTHTVEVTCATSGFRPRESPDIPNAVDDPTSVYGNPRQVQVTNDAPVFLNFRFDPVVTAFAVVRDAWTMERLEDAAVECIFEGSTGSIAVCKYPSTAVYATNWSSNFEGFVQPEPVLYLHNYDIQISRAGYQTFTSNSIISNAAPGDVFNLGELFLTPVDNNTNLIADAWESLYFGGSNVLADADADGDGVCNRDEYVAGTNPTDPLSFLGATYSFSSNTLVLTWNTEAWRTYRVSGNIQLVTGEWVQVAGSWEATNGQTEMSWTETNLDLSWNSNYRIDVMPCTWTGTNQVLMNTNSPFGSGISGDGTNLPPLP